MSTTIDERVVEMRFDNKQFESGVSTTMSTLDKLKAALGFKGATKGFEEIGAAANKVDLSGIAKSADTVGLRFNAMYTIADQAFRNITNSAMQAGKNIASALTIDPIKTGLSEYETKINAIQVIKANTRDKYDDEAAQMADIEEALSELNDYADRTIYNYTQMTSNVGKFVAQGLGVTEATKAVQGLANLAGASGASAEDMARATYQMSQALGGTIRKIDWNSLRNANMATTQLKDTLMALARVEGIDIDEMIAEKGTFEDTLEKGWLSGELFTKAMNIYSDVYSEAELKAMGFADEQVKNFKELAKMASEATTEVKTFSQLWDVLKETAQSGWTQTWEIIIGDFDTAKKMFTGMQNYFSDIINGWSKARNWIVEGVLNFTKPWTAIMEKLDGAGLGGIKNAVDTIKGAIGTLEEFQEIVNKVWRGDYNNRGDNPDRKDLLEAAGWNYDVVQDLVNKGYQYKLTMEDVEASHKKFGITMEKTAESTEDSSKTVDAMTFALENLSDEQLKTAGLTEDEIKLFRDIADEAIRTGISFDEMVEKMSTVSGRTLLIESFKNAWSGILGIAKAVGGAFGEIFEGPSIPRIYTMIESLNTFSEKLRLTDKETGELTETGKKFQRIFKGVFAVIDIITTVLGGAFKIAFKIAGQVLDYFGLSILDAAAWIGDLLVKFHDWFESLIDVKGILEVVVPWIQKAAEAVSDWYDSFKSSKGIQDATKYIKDLGTGIKDWWTSLKDAEDLPKTIAEGIFNFFSNIPSIISTVYSNIKSAFTGGFPAFDQTPFGQFLGKLQNGLNIAGQTVIEFGKLVLGKFNEFLSARGMKPITEDMISGFVNGLKENATKVYNQIVTFAKNIIDKAKEVLGIHSPSTVFFAIGGFIIAGLLGGLSAAFPQVREFFGNMFGKIGETFKDFDMSKLFAVLTSAGIVVGLKKLGDGLGSITDVIGGAGEVLSGVGTVLVKSARPIAKVIKSASKVVNNFAKSLKKIGYAIADNIKADAFVKKANAIMTIAKAVLMLVGALVVLALIPTGDLIKAGIALAVVVGAIVLLIKTLDKTKKTTIDTALFTGMVLSLAASLLILAIAAKMFAGLSWEGLGKAGAAIVVLGGVMVGLMAATKLVSKTEKGNMSTGLEHIGKMLIKMAASMLILAISAKIFASMTWEDLSKAAAIMIVLAGVMVGLMAATKLIAKTDKGNISTGIEHMGKTIMKIAGSMLILAIAAKIFATMSWEDLGKAGAALLALAGMMVGLTAATKLVGKGQNVGQIGKMLQSIATTLLILAVVAKIIAGMTWEDMGKAGVGILALSGIIVGLIAATRLAGSKDISKLAGVLLGIAGVMFVLTLVAKIIAGMSWGDMGKAGVGLVALGGIITGLIAATKLAGGTQLKETGVTLLLISVAIAILAGIAIVLSLIDLSGLAKGVIAVGILSGLMAMLIYVTKHAQQCKDELTALTVAIALMAGSIALLSMIDGTKLATATACLGAVMGMFALMILASSKAGKSMGSLIVMTLAIGMMAGMLYLLAQLPVEQTQGSAVALASLMLAMSGVLIILSVVGKSAKSALKGVLALTALVVPMAAFCLAIAYLPDISGKRDSILALVTVMGAMILLLIPLSIIGKLAGTSALLGVLALTAMVVPLAAFCLALAYLPDCTKAVGNAILLTQLMTAMTILLIPLTLIGLLGPTAFIGVLALTAMAIPMVAFVGILALMQNIQNATTNTMLLIAMMNTLTDVLVKIALIAPLAIIGVVALTALTALMTVMGIFAVAVGALMTKFPKLEEFLNKGLPILEQLAESLGTMIGKFVAGFATAVTAALPEIGQSLSDFMTNAMPFIMGAKLVDGAVLEGVGILTASILALTAADLIENVVSFFSGGTSFASLGTELSMFMMNAMPFIMGAKLIDPTAMEGVKTLAEALMIITAADLVEGLTSWLTGGSSLGDFGKQLAPFGEGIRDFSNAVKGIDNESVKVAAEAGKTLAEMANTIPNSGGWLGKIFGNNDAGDFGKQMQAFGESLAKFSGAVDNGGVNAEAVTAAVESAEKIIEVTKKIPNSGGLLGDIMGNNDPDTFGKQMSSFGNSLAEFSGAVSNGAVDIEAVTNACDAANKLVEFSKKIPNSGGLLGAIMGNNDADAFGAKMLAFGSSLAEFSTSIAGGIDLDAVDAFATAFTTLGASGMDKFVEAFTNGAPAVDAAVLTLIQHTIERIQLTTPSLQVAIAAAVNSSITQIRTGYVGFYSAGDFLVQGFAAGITENTYKPVAKARAMALAALQAAKAALGINSPSKEFYKVGYGTIEGFVNAIDDNSGEAQKATTTMADKLKSSFQTAMDKVNNLLSTDLNAQPTIRPILDLSDVSAGARSIGSMFNSPTLAMANIGAISTISAQRQNGVGNGDLLSAIKDLGSNLGKTGNTYSINGINVAEGTEAADVIHSLVRVMKMEGRS